MSGNLFDSAYERLAVVDEDRPCHVGVCEKFATTQERRYALSSTSPSRDEDRMLLFCREHAHDALIDHREAEAVLRERSAERTAPFVFGLSRQTKFGVDFDLNSCNDAELAADWEQYRERLNPFVDWLPEPCFRDGCPRPGDMRAPQLCVDLQFSSWARIDRWYCGMHAATARRHAEEAEAALTQYNADWEAATDDDHCETLTEACTAVLQRTRCHIRSW